MKKIAMIIGGILLVGIVVVLCMAMMKPDEFRVERSTVIKASPEEIFAVIGDLRRSTEWSPWEKLDPNIRRVYYGKERGKGASYAWEGNDEVGKGSMTISEYDPPRRMVMFLHFDKPMQGDNCVIYALSPQADGTKFTWTMFGPNPLLGKIMTVFMHCEDMCGKAFEEGLANLKGVCEKQSQPTS